MEAGEKGRESIVRQIPSKGFELRRPDGKGIPVGELVEASDDSVLQITS